MLQYNESESLWVEKFRPQKINDCILPSRLKDFFNEMISKGELQNMIFCGSAGTGKTTSAKALCNELGIEYLLVNASENGNIDMLRTTLRSFASTISFTSEYKVVILDEADFLTPLVQASLRGFIEEFSKNCRFILTANFENKLIDALKSRCVVVNFALTKEEKTELLKPLDFRIKEILKQEGVEYDKKALATLILKYLPDIRKILNHLQRHTKNGTLEDVVITTLNDDSIKLLFKLLKDHSKWNDVRKWVTENNDNDFSTVIRTIYERSPEYVKPSSLPQLVLTLSEFDYKSSFCADRELHLIACLTTLMAEIEYK
ncbi:MAG: AAA family ATPase [Flavobacterium sp.]|uniref:AAA family ATPase n=1 Tax=Flavobacterium sp. TaxID=239 RepID=UPI00263596DF|nr:AAA family ATPase [Flavobacterium sp.]MDD5150432.1 AAA family ATPase [Flavobacterium sp.]